MLQDTRHRSSVQCTDRDGARWREPERGYSARMAMMSDKDRSDYDHLSRFGEWDYSAKAQGEDVG